MSNIQIFKKEVPPMSVRDLQCELKTLSVLVEEWADCRRSGSSTQLFKRITARLSPDLMKALVMIAQKQTSSILKNREKVWLTYLGRVRLYGVTVKHFMQWVDVMITDSSYTQAEYPSKIGWGHGTMEGHLQWVRRVGAGTLVCTHHEPTRSDDALEKVFGEALAGCGYVPGENGEPKVMLAREGLEIVL